MATTKADIQTQINTITDGGLNPAPTVREVFGTDPDSLLEAIYNDSVGDSHVLETYTTSNVNFDYLITIHKVGSDITITGNFLANSSLPSATTIFTVSNTDYQSTTNSYYETASKFGSTDQMVVFMNTSELKIGNSILSGEKYNFTIKYKSLN